MFSKIALVPLIILGFMLSGMAGECFADVSGEIEQAQSKIISLIQEGDYVQAVVRTRVLIAEHSTEPILLDTLYLIAREYEWSDRYKNAKGTYQQMLKTNPDNTWSSKAKLGVARTEVLFLIMSKDN